MRNASSAMRLSGLSKYFRIPSVYRTNQFLFHLRRTEPSQEITIHKYAATSINQSITENAFIIAGWMYAFSNPVGDRDRGQISLKLQRRD